MTASIAVAGLDRLDGLAEMVAGPELAARLAALYPLRADLSHADAAALTTAAARLGTWARAMSLGFTHDCALRRHDPSDPTAHGRAPDRNSAPLIAVLLTRTDRSAQIEVGFSHDLLTRLPDVHAAMLGTRIDERGARALCEATAAMPEDLARHVCALVLGDPEPRTPAQLRTEALRTGIGCDPDLMDKIYRNGLAKRDVTTHREADGTATLHARHMPAEDGAAAQGAIDHLAKAAKRDGDPRPLGFLRQQITAGLLSRAYAGLTDHDILAHLATTRPDDHPGDPTGDPDDGDPTGEPTGGPPGDHPGGDSDAATDTDDGDGETDAAPPRTVSPVPAPHTPGHGIDVRVELATLLGANEHPADLGRWGPITATLARHLTHRHSPGQWKFALTDSDGYLLAADLITTRPPGHQRRDSRYASTIEIVLPTDLLTRLTNGTGGTAGPEFIDPYLLHAWRPVLLEIARRAAAATDRPPPDPTRRFSDAHLRRHIQARTPRCGWLHCPEPALTSEIDHNHDHAHGGPTDKNNQWPLCKPHHALKVRRDDGAHRNSPGMLIEIPHLVAG